VGDVLSYFRASLGKHSDLILAFSIVGILAILFTPIPPALLDFFLICNFSFALVILLLTFYVDKPLDFSTFPSLLLIATLFRLALNISATRLILSDTDAGQVIDTVGSHMVSGNYIIGLIVFLVLIVVQYIVVTNGAQRVAEVAARFTLDSMPGKQMSIDADLSAGLIDDKEAKQRRRNIEKEGSFYGAMDGASKFVKGDAIAGIVIVLIDIIGGLAIGIAQKGMAWGEALHTYTLLTIGDGIVTQIPALVISTGTGIIVTRAGSDGMLSREISRQVIAFPKTLLLVSIGLTVFLLLPGIPVVPVLIVLTIMLLLTYYSYRARQTQSSEELEPDSSDKDTDDIYSQMAVEPIEMQVGQNLISMVDSATGNFMDRVAAFRKQYALDVGFVVPRLRVKDNKKLAPNSYEISVHGVKAGEGEIYQDRILAINPGDATKKLEGVATKDPTYQLPAVWIQEDARKSASTTGYTIVDPSTVLMTHLSEIFKQQSANLLSRAETERMLARVRESDPGLIEELVPNVLAVTDIQKVLQNLLSEKVSIRNIIAIVEVLVDKGKETKDIGVLTELVRQKLATAICQSLADENGELHVLTLDPKVESSLAAGVKQGVSNAEIVIEPNMAQQLLQKLSAQVESMMKENHLPVLLCSPELRRYIWSFTVRVMPQLSVVSMTEIPNTVRLRAFGMVNL